MLSILCVVRRCIDRTAVALSLPPQFPGRFSSRPSARRLRSVSPVRKQADGTIRCIAPGSTNCAQKRETPLILSGAFPSPLTAQSPPGRRARVHLDSDPDANLHAVDAMPLVRNANSTNAGFRAHMRCGHSQSRFNVSFLDLGNLSEMSFWVFSRTSVEKRVMFICKCVACCLGMSW
jgi:hypothetical protein